MAQKLYTREDAWKAVKEVFNPTASIYQLGDQVFPVSNTKKQDNEMKKMFFEVLDEIAHKKIKKLETSVTIKL